MVYCGGLENRCAVIRTGGSNPSLSARKNSVKNLTLIIVAVLVAAVFIMLWRQGAFLKLAAYFDATKEELKKCTWPTFEDLKGSTAVVMVAIALLGAFTVLVDLIFTFFIKAIV